MKNIFVTFLMLVLSCIAKADEYAVSDQPGYYSIQLLIDKCPSQLSEAISFMTNKINSQSDKTYVAVLPETIGGQYFQVDYMAIDDSVINPIGKIKFEFNIMVVIH